MKINFTIIISLLIFGMANGQKKDVNDFNSEYINWYNKDLAQDNIVGASIDKAYAEIINNLPKKKNVIVAIIDGGVDIHHKDLIGKIWINENEIAGNGIDDDNNGYIDDINGWNFIGNKSGENIYYENLEITRIVKTKDENHPDYYKAKILYEKEVAKRKKQKESYTKFENAWESAKTIIKKETGIIINNRQDLKKINSNNQKVIKAKKFLQEKFSKGVNDKLIKNLINNTDKYLDYYLNLNFDARKLVGDNPLDIKDRYYGNNNVIGKRADHGTSVAGVIAAIRNNGIGINGIADNVKIMVLKSTPMGDERDKDIALSIIYAVENGADIINMSFSKELSPQKLFIDDAVKFAEEHGVLIVHAAGNKGQNLDINVRYPSDIYLNGEEPTNWLNVGATQKDLNNKIIGKFSNYGKKHVDIFAPGVNIVTLDSTNTYIKTNGTSIAAPIVTGVAALILSYYPNLTPQELITIIMNSSYKVRKPKKVLVPNLSSQKREKAKFISLSKSGGIINAYNAFKYIEKNINTISN